MIRTSRTSDLPALLALTAETFLHHQRLSPHFHPDVTTPYTLESLSQMVEAEQQLCLTALDGETIVGYLFGKWTAPKSDRFTPVRILNITDVGVTDSHRSSGIGRQLMQVAEELALERKIDAVRLNVWAVNDRAATFYEELGFEPLYTSLQKPLTQK